MILFEQHHSHSAMSAFTSVVACSTAAAATDQTSPAQPKIQSRFAANSAFQRQLSSQAMMQTSSASKQPANAAAAVVTASPGRPTTAPRLFQRQATTSQLASRGSSATSYQASNTMQDYGHLSKRPNAIAKVSSNTNLSSNQLASAELTNQNNNGPPTATNKQAKITKQKRMISRMLSISAIHTTFTDSLAGANATNSSTGVAAGKQAAAASNSSQDDSHYQAGADFDTIDRAAAAVAAPTTTDHHQLAKTTTQAALTSQNDYHMPPGEHR